MPWIQDAKDNLQDTTADVAGRYASQSSNAGHDAATRMLDTFGPSAFCTGVITRSGAGLYDVVVRCHNGPDLPCLLLTHVLNNTFGVCESQIPMEGTEVFIHIPNSSANFGVVIGVIPAANIAMPLDKRDRPPRTAAHMWDVEPGAAATTEAAYTNPITNVKDLDMINANSGRPMDLFPGNKVYINEQGVAMGIMNLMATLKASDKSKIEFSLLDDFVRLCSGLWQHINSQGIDQIYNDGGFVTRESYGTSYQCERSGFADYGEELTEDESAPSGGFVRDAKTSKRKLVEDDILAKKRYHMLMGFLGDILNIFVSTPNTDANPEQYSEDTINSGLMHTHVDGSGRVIVRSAGGISFRRDDMIPVPKRKKEPWDPSGDKIEDESDPVTEKGPFKWATGYPGARSLQLRDASVYYDKQAVQRIYDRSTGADKKDWYLPEVADMPALEDEYDTQGKGSEDFTLYAGRRAYFNIEPDGSIILRSAWGDELILGQGGVTINSQNIFLRAGQSIVQLAGHDIVAKAKKSIDITATDNDVRIKANVNLELVAEGRSSVGGGILLESKAENDIIAFDAKGEETLSSGIIMKAADSRIFMDSNVVHLAGRSKVLVDTMDEDGKNQGSVEMSAKRISMNGEDATQLTSGKKAGLILSGDSAGLTGRSIRLGSSGSLTLEENDKIWQPLKKQPYSPGKYIHEELQERVEELWDTIQDSTDWLSPFTPDIREDIEFTYRSSAEYGTLTSLELDGSDSFTMYQPTWAFLANAGDELVTVQIDTWEEFEIEETYPWPGEKQYDSSAKGYVILEDEANISDSGTGVPVKRSKVSDTPGSLEPKKFNEYEVVKHT